ncbi:hypothetical protein FAM09_30385 [Niastella caeni]|uniref:DUF3224 domain-containing protein n=1 Tax=Niastella caeni TaxID=2569763 RepID=A0A4S8HCG7_9BACT|nr:hypothetical protein [Niastella caeni]THU30212.1 hypothetical protein FAM09_30385 [Niastella caeni]
MNNKFFRVISCLIVIVLGCQKDYNGAGKLALNNPEFNSTRTAGAIQIAGVGFFDAIDACNSAGQGASYALNLTGDLEGCHYFFVEEFDCSPSGTYREEGRELFVGMYKGEPGTFWTTYKFEAKYEGCAPDGSYIGAEILGRCQHPIVEGSGTGVFEGVTGRLDFKDDIEAENFPYRGHFRF